MADEEKKVEEVKEEEVKPEEIVVEEKPEEVASEPMVKETSPKYDPEEFDSGPDTVGEKVEEAKVDQNLVLDMEDTSDALPAFEPLPLGWYHSIITGTDYVASKAGNPMIKVEYTIQSAQYKNRKAFLNAVLQIDGVKNDPGLQVLKRAMVRAKVQINWKTFNPRIFCEEGVALGKDVDIKLTMGKPYRNKTTGDMVKNNRISDFRPTGSGEEFMADS